MQRIQDKALDQLFKSKFEDAAFEPSSDLWTAIENKIEPAKGKKLPIFWMAAASVTVLLTITLVFNKEERVRLQGETLVANPVSTGTVTTETELPAEQPVAVATSTRVIERNVPVKQTAAVKEIPVKESNTQTPQVVIAQADPVKEVQKETTLSAQLPVQQVAIASIDYGNITTEVVNDNDQSDRATERKGIRNVGDLVNFVVDKVDKRDKKAIRFRTDDDDSSLIGINIGFLKFNSRKDR